MGRRKLVEDDELLAVAREVFVEKGIAASTREIAHRAGISEAVIYPAMVSGVERVRSALHTSRRSQRRAAARGDRPRHDDVLPRGDADPHAARDTYGRPSFHLSISRAFTR